MGVDYIYVVASNDSEVDLPDDLPRTINLAELTDYAVK